MSEKSLLNIGISMGDPNGVGPEIIIKALQHKELLEYFVPVVYGNPKAFVYYAKKLDAQRFRFNQISKVAEAKNGEINLISTGDKEYRVEAGEASNLAGKEAFEALNRMVKDALNGEIQAMVTAPLDKSTVKPEGETFNGHTGYLAKSMEAENYLMLLASEELKVGLVTEHLALSEIKDAINTELIYKKLKTMKECLVRDYSITKPKIAVLGLNPHNGDNGLMGEEETSVIKPAIKQAFEEGDMVYGPYPADGFFGNRIFRQFDAVLAMYHDQGLIPFKYIAFEDGINFTAGLPIVRTSPDHGTAYDIAGKGIASTTSFVTALFDAIKICYRRNENEGMKANYLEFSKLRPERFKMNFSL